MVFRLVKQKKPVLILTAEPDEGDAASTNASSTEVSEPTAENQEDLPVPSHCESHPAPAQETLVESQGDAAAYELGPVIHRDSHSTVYRAMRNGSQDRLSLHVFLKELAEQQLRDKFSKAAAKAMTWSHKNIAKVHDFGFSDCHKPFVVTDEIPGSSLHDVLQREKKFNKERTIRMFTEISDALGYISWTKSEVDDLSTVNVMIVRDSKAADHLKLINIGLQMEATAELENLPPTGSFVAYASPERCMGQDTDERSAIYSVGCMMFEALTGKVPFSADTEMQVIQKHLTERPPCVFKEGRQRDRKLESIVMRCLEKKPGDRYQTFNELSGELESLSHANKSVQSLTNAPRINLPWAKFFTAATDCIIALVAITLTVGSIQYMIKDYNRQVHDLKTTIKQAETFGFYGTAAANANLTHIWETALQQAAATQQPLCVIGDLELNHGQALMNQEQKEQAVQAFTRALNCYERDHSTADLETAYYVVLSQITASREPRTVGESPFVQFTPQYCHRNYALLERLSKDPAGPNNQFLERARADLAGILVQKRQYDRAEKLYKEYLNSSFNAQNVFIDMDRTIHMWQLAECLKRQSKLTQSLLWFDRALQDIEKGPIGFDEDYKAIGASYKDALEQLGRKKQANALAKRIEKKQRELSGETQTEVSNEPAQPPTLQTLVYTIAPEPAHDENYDPFTGTSQ